MSSTLFDVREGTLALDSPRTIDLFKKRKKDKKEEEEEPKLPSEYVLASPSRPLVAHDDFLVEIPVLGLPSLRERTPSSFLLLSHAASTWGIFYLTNHPIPTHILDRMLQQNSAFASLPLERKLKAHVTGSVMGYNCNEMSVGTKENLPWSEGMTVTEHDVRKYARAVFSEDSEFEEFSRAYEDYIASNTALSLEITNLLFECLKADITHLSKPLQQRLVFLHMNYYPVSPEPDKTIGIGPHFDHSYVSSLYTSDVGGLQVLKDGQWFAVRPRKGAIAFLVGLVTEVVSNGTFPAVYHRAVNSGSKDRISVNLFLAPDMTSTLSAPPELEPHLYRPFTFTELSKARAEVKDSDVRSYFKVSKAADSRTVTLVVP